MAKKDVLEKMSLKFSGKITGDDAVDLIERARNLFDDFHKKDPKSRVDLSITSHTDKKGGPVEASIGKF